MKLFTDDIYDLKALKKYLLILVSFTGLSYVSKGYAFVALPIFVLWAVSKGLLVDLLFWVMVLSFTGVSNPYLFPKTTFTFVIARLLLFAVAGILMLRVVGRRNARIVSPFVGIFIYIAWEAIVSIQGFGPIVSYLKILLFVPIYLALYTVANEVTASTRVNAKAVRSAILAIVVFIVFGSLALWPFPGISQLMARTTEDIAKIAQMVAEGDSLFMGITNHSQALGPMLGVMLTLVFGDLVFSFKRWEVLYVATLVVGAFLIVKTSSRTAMGTFIAGIAMMVWLFALARSTNARWKAKVMSGIFLLGLVGGVAVLFIPSIRDRAMSFALKFNPNSAQIEMGELTFANVTSSRQGLVDAAMANFKKKPFTGNGFQVSEEMQYQNRSGFLDYMSAPIEKGVWPTAVLEEGGVPGLLFFAGFLICCFCILVKRHAYIGAGTLWVFTVVNLGEFSFFSMSYTGGFQWALVFAAVILDGQRMKNVGLQVWEVPIEVVMEEVGYDEWVRRRS